MTTVDIRAFTRTRPKGIPFEVLAHSVLPGWEISLVFAGERRAQQLNVALRNKNYTPNVLSYVSGKKSGEIIICPLIARKQAPAYGMSQKAFVAYLFIHGLFHLKGLPHGATMEKQERTILARYGFSTSSSPLTSTHSLSHGSTNRNRN